MPTGYTDTLYKGEDQTFEQFAMQCARAFGALIDLRDEPHAEIPDRFEPSSWERKSVDDALSRVFELRRRTLKQWADAQDSEIAEHNEHVRTAIRKAIELQSRYELMLSAVRGWRPPTEEHKGLQEFMVQQLQESIRFDCSGLSLVQQRAVPVAEYAQRTQDAADRELDRAEEAWRKAQERTAGRTAWVQALRDSLGGA